MAKYCFDATEHAPWQGDDDAEQYALRAWLAEPAEMDLITACTMAPIIREVYDELWDWAVKSKNELQPEAKAALFDALVLQPPRRGMVSRDDRLRAIAWVLETRYGLNKTSADGVIDILAKLPRNPPDGTKHPQHDAIRKILYAKKLS